jgi:AAA+ ATPase superfamily predicted ATPase
VDCAIDGAKDVFKFCASRTGPSFFFGREMEIAGLRAIFHGPPRLTVMLGPPSTGKTRLVNRVVSSRKIDGTPEFHSLTINLRGVALNSGKQFWEHIESTSGTASAADNAWALFADSASKIRSLKLAVTGLEVGLLESSIQYKFDFDSLAKAVPILKCGSDVPFVLVIDEANAFKKLAENDYSVRTPLELWTDADLVTNILHD